ncbi:MAG: DNA alkylation repair protein [bacterium]
MSVFKLKAELRAKANKERARVSQSFFKTGKGEYGEGDIFLGLTVPDQRKIAYGHVELSLGDLEGLLKSKIHEHRFVVLEILVFKFEQATKIFDKKSQKKIFNFYLEQAKAGHINNWDLVDTSAREIVGAWLFDKNRRLLYKMARSKNLWERRVSIVSSHYLITRGQYKDTLALSRALIADKHDLIHKASGWMLREVGKKDPKILEAFLAENASIMPRTMLRYAIERLPLEKKALFMGLSSNKSEKKLKK